MTLGEIFKKLNLTRQYGERPHAAAVKKCNIPCNLKLVHTLLVILSFTRRKQKLVNLCYRKSTHKKNVSYGNVARKCVRIFKPRGNTLKFINASMNILESSKEYSRSPFIPWHWKRKIKM